MTETNRRSFFRKVIGGIAAVTVAPLLPKTLPHTAGSFGGRPQLTNDELTDFQAMKIEEIRQRYLRPAVAYQREVLERYYYQEFLRASQK